MPKLLLAGAALLALGAARPAAADALYVFNGVGPNGGAESFTIDVGAQDPANPAVAAAFVDFTGQSGAPFDATAPDTCTVQVSPGGCTYINLWLDSNGIAVVKNGVATNYDYVQIFFNDPNDPGNTLLDNFVFAPGTLSTSELGLPTLNPAPDQFATGVTLDADSAEGLQQGTGEIYAYVPEPASAALLGLGLPLLAWRRRRAA